MGGMFPGLGEIQRALGNNERVLGQALIGTASGTLISLTLASWAPGPLALTGFARMGVGSSAIFPLAMSAAAQATDRPAAVNVAALAQTPSPTASWLGVDLGAVWLVVEQDLPAPTEALNRMTTHLGSHG